jgi:hypothetical protein
MKSLQKLSLLFALILIFASCQSGTDVSQSLSKPEIRTEMMNKIADDNTMAKEMMGAMMNSQNGKMMMQQHQTMMMGDNSSMMKMMKDNPSMMNSMMMNMMEACKNDTAMMSGMCKTMMGNKEMIDMMQKMNGEKMEMKMNGMKH